MTPQAAALWTSWTRHRDEQSFETLVRPELPHAMGFARRLGCSAADAEDAVQDALARLAGVRDDSPATVGVRAWLCREVHVRARSRLRSERRRRLREAAVALDPARESAAPAVTVRDEVERALSELDEDEREALELRYLHDLDYREIALVVRASEGACRLRVHKALARLRARFGADAAAVVAAVPLAAVGDIAALVKGALAKTAFVSTASGGMAVMATTAQKVAIAAVAAAALGIAGTLTVQRTFEPETAATSATTAAAPEEAPRTAASRGSSRAADAASAAEIESLRSRVTDLERSLAAASERAADLDAMDPMAVLVYAKKPIEWKARKLLEITDDKQRWAAIAKVTTVLAERECTGREMFESLKTETEIKVIDMIGLLSRSSLLKTPAADRRAFVELLRAAPMAETRAAAANALFMSEQFRGGFDESVKSVAKEMNGYLIDALRTESSSEVAGAIAKCLDGWSPPSEAVEALRLAAGRLPPSPGRRSVWEAIARGSVRTDSGLGLFREFESATAQDVKDDIAAGIARMGNSMSGMGGVKSEDAAKYMADCRARFRIVFGGTSDVAVRKSLLRGTLYGLNCVAVGPMDDEKKADTVRFFRETSALETDAKQREKIERVAATFEQKGSDAYSDFDKIMSAKE